MAFFSLTNHHHFRKGQTMKRYAITVLSLCSAVTANWLTLRAVSKSLQPVNDQWSTINGQQPTINDTSAEESAMLLLLPRISSKLHQPLGHAVTNCRLHRPILDKSLILTPSRESANNIRSHSHRRCTVVRPDSACTIPCGGLVSAERICLPFVPSHLSSTS